MWASSMTWQDIGKEIYSVHAFGWWWVRRTCRRRGTVFCGIITDFWNLSVWARNGHTVKVAQAWARKPRSTKDGQGKEIYSVHDFGWWWVRRSTDSGSGYGTVSKLCELTPPLTTLPPVQYATHVSHSPLSLSCNYNYVYWFKQYNSKRTPLPLPC